MSSIQIKPKKKRVRVRPHHPRPICDIGIKYDAKGTPRNIGMLRLYWPREQDFRQEAYEEMKAYLIERKCKVTERPQYTYNPQGPMRQLYVQFDRSQRHHDKIKRKAARLKCGMRTESTDVDPFEYSTLSDSAEQEPDEGLLKGA